MFRTFIAYFRHLLASIHLHGIHSPFVFDFNKNVIKNTHRYYAFDDLEAMRSKLLLSKQKIKVQDFGAGSKKLKGDLRGISKILKSSSKSKKHAELLFRISNFSKAEDILELGTSLGMGTAYLAAANPKARLTTVEACPNLSKIAEINFKKLGLTNINLVNAEFDEVLDEILQSHKKLDLVFIDGNHNEEATIRYFEKCQSICHPNSIIIVDDIHWSVGMQNAWKTIKQHPQLTVSLDLFEMGLVFFREQQAKEHFTIRH